MKQAPYGDEVAGTTIRRMRWFLVVIALGLACSKAREPAPAAAQVPADSALVVTLSVAKLRASPQWPKLEAALAAKLPLAAIKQTCGADPVKSVDSVMLAIPDDLAPDRSVVVVRGVARDVAESCAKSFAATQNQMIEINDEAGLTGYRQGDEAVFVSWLDATAFAALPGALTSKDSLAKVGKLGAPRDPVLGDVLARLRGGHLIELAFSAPPQSGLAGFIAQSGMEPQSAYGWVDLDTTLRAEIVAVFATKERAAAAATKLPPGPLSKFKATVRDREVVFSVELDATETTQLIDQLVTMTR
jgi:hypothetical protein